MIEQKTEANEVTEVTIQKVESIKGKCKFCDNLAEKGSEFCFKCEEHYWEAVEGIIKSDREESLSNICAEVE